MKSWLHVSVSRGMLLAIGLTASVVSATAADPSSLRVVAQSDLHDWGGVVVSPDHRILVLLPRLLNNTGPSLARVGADGGLLAYPDAAWNMAVRDAPAGAPGADQSAASGPGPRFVGLAAIRLAPDGSLWVVDTGSPGYGKPVVPGGARLIRIDLATDAVTQILAVPGDVLRPASLLGEIRFNGSHAYLADTGAPGLIVLDLATGQFRRVLDQATGLVARRPVTLDGQTLRGPDGKLSNLQAMQMEVSPDGKTLFVQPLCGPMSRIATRLLDSADTSSAAMSAGLSFWYDTPAVGGTAMLPDGTLLLEGLEDDSLLALSADRGLIQLLADPRLDGAGAPFLAQDGTLTIPASQLGRAAAFNQNTSKIRFPVSLYAVDAAHLLQAATATPGTPSRTEPR